MTAKTPLELEQQRQQALERYDILDSAREATFDRLTGLASLIFGVPLAMINFIDAHRQWTKSCHGADPLEVERGQSLCDYTIRTAGATVVPDARQYPPFADNPFVQLEPGGIRFYAGMPLTTSEGQRIGTFCLVDTVPRPRLTEDEVRILGELAALTVTALEARLAERRTHETEEELRQFFAISSDLIALFDTQGVFRRVNSAWEGLLGHPLPVGETFQTFLHPDDVVASEKEYARILQERTAIKCFENRVRHRNGTYRWLQWTANLSADGQTIFTTARDITEHKALLERLRLFESVVVHTNDAVLVTEAEPIELPGPRILYVNEAFCRMTGYRPEEVLGKTPRLLQGMDTDRAPLERIKAALKAWQPVRAELLNYRKDGTPFWVEIDITPIADETGWFTHWVSVQRDICDRKEAEKLAQVREERLRSLYALSALRDNEAVFERALAQSCGLLNMEAGFIAHIERDVYTVSYLYAPGTRLEPGTRALLGSTYCASLLESRGVLAVSGAEVAPHRRHALYRELKINSYLGAAIIVRGEVYGTLSFVSARAQAFGDNDEEFISHLSRFIAAAIERSQADSKEELYLAELEGKNAQLEQASRLKSEFLANMSHELRTPLTAIIGFSEILREELYGGLNTKQKGYTQDIYSSGTHLLALINDILDVSKIEAGKMTLQLETLSLAELVSETVKLLRERARARQITLTMQLAPELTPIIADRLKVKQALLNLLSNALKFTPEGGSVSVRLRETPDELRLEVTDTGIGIAEGDLPRLFREFVQLDASSARRFEGTGLGLALTKRLIELQGGRVWVESRLAQGSTFGFSLPRHRDETAL